MRVFRGRGWLLEFSGPSRPLAPQSKPTKRDPRRMPVDRVIALWRAGRTAAQIVADIGPVRGAVFVAITVEKIVMNARKLDPSIPYRRRPFGVFPEDTDFIDPGISEAEQQRLGL